MQGVRRDRDVLVGVIEPGDDRAPAHIDDRGVRVGESAQRVIRAHRGDALPAERHGFGRRTGGIGSEHLAVAEQDVDPGWAPSEGGRDAAQDFVHRDAVVTVAIARAAPRGRTRSAQGNADQFHELAHCDRSVAVAVAAAPAGDRAVREPCRGTGQIPGGGDRREHDKAPDRHDGEARGRRVANRTSMPAGFWVECSSE